MESILNDQLHNTMQTDKKAELFKIHETTSNIFNILEQDGIFKIILGNRIAAEETFNSLDECEEYINKKPWQLIATLTLSMAEYVNK